MPRRKTSDQASDKPAREKAYEFEFERLQTAEVMERVMQNGKILRMRKIARLDIKGLSNSQIAAELQKGSSADDWSLERVLFLKGEGSGGDKSEREDQRSLYVRVLEEVRHPELVDPEVEIRDMVVFSLGRIREAIETLPTKESAELALRFTKQFADNKSDGTKVYEYRMDDETREALAALKEWKKPDSMLDQRIALELADHSTEN